MLDETGFLKKGRASAGVQRPCTGTAGRIENAQVGVFLDLATERGRVLINRRLYLPEHPGPMTPNAAGIPETVQFATEPCLAQEMIAAAPEAGITASRVAGDEALPTAGTRALSRPRLNLLGHGDRTGPASSHSSASVALPAMPHTRSHSRADAQVMAGLRRSRRRTSRQTP
ncbi:hypothetical protein SSPNP10_22470 [Streptomyces sp. NP10]|nr:hypothetical protein SSPNP10_22470 [Streptomyces sp. NP10]